MHKKCSASVRENWKARHVARSVEWDDPYGGECSDVFVLSDGGRSLTQLSDMTIRGSGQRCQYRHGRMVLSLLLN